MSFVEIMNNPFTTIANFFLVDEPILDDDDDDSSPKPFIQLVKVRGHYWDAFKFSMLRYPWACISLIPTTANQDLFTIGSNVKYINQCYKKALIRYNGPSAQRICSFFVQLLQVCAADNRHFRYPSVLKDSNENDAEKEE